MNTIQNTLLRHLHSRVTGSDGFVFTGWMPDDVHRIGNRFPCCLIEDGDQQEYRQETGGRIIYTHDVRFWVYHNVNHQRITVMNELTDSLMGLILARTGYDSAVRSLDVVSVEKGMPLDEPVDLLAPGIYNNVTIHTVHFRFVLEDRRVV